MVECPARKLAGFFMRFTIRDLLWLMAMAGIGVLLLLELESRAGLVSLT
jgi:hypothetical protein